MRLRAAGVVLGASAALWVGACGGDDGAESAGGGGCDGKIEGKQTVTAWFHSGTGPERETFDSWVKGFNQSQDQVTLDVTLLPEGNYNDQVKAAAASNKLPDLLDFDGPNLYNYAWNQSLQPLDDCLPADLKGDLLPTIVKQGTYDDTLYGVGNGESGLGLYARPSVLEKNGIRIPEGPDDAWSAAEFTAALEKLQKAGFEKPLDLQINQDDNEFYTYAFSPIVQSAGADLIDREDYQSADGVLNSPQAVEAMKVFQSWFEKDLVDSNEDDAAFVSGRTPISWVGHWKFSEYTDKFGKDLVIVPLPDFGEGTRTGQGSWQWGVTSKAKDTDAAFAFIEYMLQREQQLDIAKNGGVPSNSAVLDTIDKFAEGGAEHVYVQQLEGGAAVPRPQTPAYPTITNAFRRAVSEIRDGADPQEALDAAAKAIDQDIEDNDGYPTQ